MKRILFTEELIIGVREAQRQGRSGLIWRKGGWNAPKAPVLALPNQCWSYDLVHDQLSTGRRFRVLNIVDDVTRECLHGELQPADA